MRDKAGKQPLPVWREYNNRPYFVAARTRKEAAEILDTDPDLLSRVKGVFATGKPREL